ncbi:MAG TPA: PEGA domain-containing protein, partial [Archangium sp.]|uniref:PEGA domain-containing protein n=1 Tax=Archangium sp. TaxID=1872627 RepID=UPI002ED9BC31
VRPETPSGSSEPPVLTPSRPSTSHSVVTAPARPSLPHPEPMVHEEPEAEEVEQRTTASPGRAQRSAPARQQPPAASGNNRLALIAALAALAVVLVGVVGVFLKMRPEPTGFILVRLASEVRGPIQVNVNGNVLDVKSWPLLHQVKAGPGLVLISADGYKDFTQQVVIEQGTTPTSLEVKLERKVQVGRVVIVTQPPDAELQVGGKVVRPRGDSSTYIGELEAGTPVVVAASAPGFKPAQQNIEPAAGEKPMNVQLKLEPDGYEVEVLSVPSGATILAGGKELGTTPARLKLPLTVKQMSLKLRCHDDVEVDVTPASGGSPATVRERLKKQRGCR